MVLSWCSKRLAAHGCRLVARGGLVLVCLVVGILASLIEEVVPLDCIFDECIEINEIRWRQDPVLHFRLEPTEKMLTEGLIVPIEWKRVSPELVCIIRS